MILIATLTNLPKRAAVNYLVAPWTMAHTMTAAGVWLFDEGEESAEKARATASREE